MIGEKQKSSAETIAGIHELRANRDAALEKFRMLADSPTSIQQGADMAKLAQLTASANDTCIAALTAGRPADAYKLFRTASAAANATYTKAQEAMRFQEGRVAQDEKARQESSTWMWVGLIVGSLLAVMAAIFGGMILTRGIRNSHSPASWLIFERDRSGRFV